MQRIVGVEVGADVVVGMTRLPEEVSICADDA